MRMLLHGRAIGKAVSMTMSMSMALSTIVGATMIVVGLMIVTVVVSMLVLAFILKVTATLVMVTVAVTMLMAIIMEIARCRRCGWWVRSMAVAGFLSGIPTAVRFDLLPGSGSTQDQSGDLGRRLPRCLGKRIHQQLHIVVGKLAAVRSNLLRDFCNEARRKLVPLSTAGDRAGGEA